MAEEWTRDEMQDALNQLRQKAATDKEFRALVLAKPADAVAQIGSKPLPEGVSVKFIESDPDADRTFVLPQFQGEGLSEEELDKVAGGQVEEGEGERGWVCNCDDKTCYLNIL